jgi:hypothetical protein
MEEFPLLTRVDAMSRRTLLAAGSCLLLLAAGPARADSDDEKAVRLAFADLQAAVKAGDPDKLWPLLDSASQAGAEDDAKALRESYAKAGAKDKVKLEKAHGFTADEIAALTGKAYLKSKRFLGKYDELPDGKVEKVAVDGDKAVVGYVEADGDHQKIDVVRQDGKWKVVARAN